MVRIFEDIWYPIQLFLFFLLVGARPLFGRAFSCTLGGWGGVGHVLTFM